MHFLNSNHDLLLVVDKVRGLTTRRRLQVLAGLDEILHFVFPCMLALSMKDLVLSLALLIHHFNAITKDAKETIDMYFTSA